MSQTIFVVLESGTPSSKECWPVAAFDSKVAAEKFAEARGGFVEDIELMDSGEED
jgi:hypothetical protein